MRRINLEISPELARQIDRIVRDGWFADDEALFREALHQFVESKTFLGDSPRMLQRFAADALNDSKPETALKFVNRALSLVSMQPHPDRPLEQQLVELKVQILLVLERASEALDFLESARERLPNNPTVTRWLERVRKAAKPVVK